ncbi:unnamed protein product, partial [Prunus brigantina]
KKVTSTCRNGEGFVKLAHVKIPDSSTTRTNMMWIRRRRVESWHGDLMDTRTYLDMVAALVLLIVVFFWYCVARKKKGSLDCMIVFLLCGTGRVFLFKYAIRLLVLRLLACKERDYKFSLRLATGSTYLEDSTADVDETRINSDFDLATISVATNNFSVANKLGKGGFGTVRI